MCGIYGTASTSKLTKEAINKITVLGHSLKHRGPDDNVQIWENYYAIGFNRLAIVDALNGMQPFYNFKENIIVTANGEIYNHHELRRELTEMGVKFDSECDVEVIPHLYEIYGNEFIKKLRGMFAISILDKRSNQLKLFADRLGEKPIYWSLQNGSLYYSSELTPLLESRIIEMCLNSEQIPSYLKFGFVPDPYTIIKDVYRVSPGTYLSFSITDGSLVQDKYWSVDLPHQDLVNPISNLKTVLRNIGDSICQGEAKIGVALSGGLDSRLVAELAKSSGNIIEAITIGYSEKSRHDESKSAFLASQKIGIKHHLKRISSDDAVIAFRESCFCMDEPVADISCVNYLTLFKTAKKLGIRVLLMGHGSDEVLMGYHWLNTAARRAEIRSATLQGNFSFLGYLRLLESPFSYIRQKNLFGAYRTLIENIFTLNQIFLDYQDYKIGNETIDFYALSPETKRKILQARKLISKPIERRLPTKKLKPKYQASQHWKIARLQIISNYLRVNGLLQIDKLSMAHSVEVRNPLVDFTFIEAVLGCNWNNPEIPNKALLRAAQGLSLSEVSEVPLKQGFSPPTRIWYKRFQKEFFQELSNPRSIELGIFPKNWQKKFRKPFSRLTFLKSPIWFELFLMEMWIRTTEQRVGCEFTKS